MVGSEYVHSLSLSLLFLIKVYANESICIGGWADVLRGMLNLDSIMGDGGGVGVGDRYNGALRCNIGREGDDPIRVASV